MGGDASVRPANKINIALLIEPPFLHGTEPQAFWSAKFGKGEDGKNRWDFIRRAVLLDFSPRSNKIES